ncbi:hypothetical protein [Maribellus maritimus]|uniref:hypothetical protein n=1 Tax=Maribellus maritimus TaxID=2870838 RepID=UPI001EEC0698|nr:hypothetical protein [Maribellus maritimus]MCG6187698.1 hypothetical protein [Maribellus maritimus]
MKKRNLFFIGITLVSSILFLSCGKDDESLIEENGLSKDINDFMPQAILDTMESLGMPIFTGGNPRDIEGTYLVSPGILYASNIEGDEIGERYADENLSFSSQNNSNLSLTIKINDWSSEGEETGSYIVGDNNEFSVFTKMMMYDNEVNDSALISYTCSGTISEDGIEDLFECLVMIDDFGDPNDQYIEIGAARVFYDEDGLAERMEETKSAVIGDDINYKKLKSATEN